MVKVKCILQTGFNDNEAKTFRKLGDEFEVSKERAKFLEENKAVEIIEVKPEEKKQIEAKPIKKKKKIDTDI